MFEGGRRSVGLGIILLALGCSTEPSPIETDVPIDEPWIAASSTARAQNPLAAVGDEHNRLLSLALLDAKKRGLSNMSLQAKCRWMADFVLGEVTSSRSPQWAKGAWAGRKLEAARFEKVTARIGCKAADITDLVQWTPAMVLANVEEGDTVDYYPSSEAQAFFSQLESAVASSSSPQQFDAAAAAIQAQIGDLWDAEAVYAVASTLVSSAYYWQSTLSGGSAGGGDPWAEGEYEMAPPSLSVGRGGVLANADAGSVALADGLGCIAGFWGGRKSIFGIARMILIPNSVWADCAVYGVLASIGAAM